MQGLRRCSDDLLHLDLSPPPSTTSLSLDVAESGETKIRRLISEHPVIIFSRNSCYMCHVMKKLLATIGVHPTVIELDDDGEIEALASFSAAAAVVPAVFIGGNFLGGLESLVALHLSGHLVPKLVEVGALWGKDVNRGLNRDVHLPTSNLRLGDERSLERDEKTSCLFNGAGDREFIIHPRFSNSRPV